MTKALECKLVKAAWHVMAEDAPYDAERVFGPGQATSFREDRSGVSQRVWMLDSAGDASHKS